MLLRLAMTSWLVLLSAVASEAQVESLRLLAQRLGGAATTLVNVEVPRWPLDEMVRSADLIVRGRISQHTSFLSDDESLVFTDYWISPSEIFKRTPKVNPNMPTVLQQLGGKVRLDGLMMATQTDIDLVLTTGDECFFFLSAAQDTSSLRARPGVFVAIPFGVFHISYDDIRHTKETSTAVPPPGESGASAFAATIRKLVAESKY
jgi:hypothetical protein